MCAAGGQPAGGGERKHHVQHAVRPTIALGAIVWLELGLTRRPVAGEARAVVAARSVGAVPPRAADVGHILALVVIYGSREVRLTQSSSLHPGNW